MLLSYAALLLIAVPWVRIGQREQIMLIGTVPYVALVAARRTGKVVHPLLAILVGVGGALGFVLKHYFLIVPVLLELWLFASGGRLWRWRRPELAAMVAIGTLYACAVVIFAPEFFTRIVPMVRLAYAATGAPSTKDLFGPFLIIGLLPLIFVIANARLARLRLSPLTSALLVAAVGFAAVYFIQGKGWQYHAIPMIGCSSLALAALLVETAKPTAAMRIFAPALLLLPLALSVAETHGPFALENDVQNAISDLQAGDTVGFLTVENAVLWSVTLQHGFRFPSRYMSYWMLPAVVANEDRRNPDTGLVRLGRTIVSDTVDDFRCIPPKRIIANRPRPSENTFDMLPFFLRNPNFSALLSHYKVRSRTSLETYELVSAQPPPTGPCRKGV